MSRLREDADLVMFDTPPVSTVTDPVVLATYVDGVLVVVRSGVTKGSTLRRAVEQLRRTGTRILGIVLNDIPQGIAGGAYGLQTPFGYDQDPSPASEHPVTGPADWQRRRRKEHQPVDAGL